jgi:hypothetical protein
MIRIISQYGSSVLSSANITSGFSYMETLEDVQQLYGVLVLTELPKCEESVYRGE